MTPLSHRQIGDRGEARAHDYLVSHGYTIVATCYTVRGGEIDIVALRDGLTVFIEVKYRRSTTHGTAAEALTPTKCRRLRLAIETYCMEHGTDRESIRADLIAIQGTRITHHEGIDLGDLT